MNEAPNQRGFRVGALGEIAIRCKDLDAMEAFYRDVIGLEWLATRENGIVFFKISDGFAGHTSVLALFAPETGHFVANGAGSSLHHIALSVPAAEQAAAKQWLTARGHEWREQAFPWIGWTGVFTTDPDGNTVELVAATEDETTMLHRAALGAWHNAWAPYSKFKVGAAILTRRGVHAGCNVENAAYPQGTCAEAGAIAAMVAAGETRAEAVLIVADGPEPCTPCGGCRQKLSEFGTPDMPVILANTKQALVHTTLGALLPGAFHAGQLEG